MTKPSVSHRAIGLIPFFIIYEVRAPKMRGIWEFVSENIRLNLTKSLSGLELWTTSYYIMSVCPPVRSCTSICISCLLAYFHSIRFRLNWLKENPTKKSRTKKRNLIRAICAKDVKPVHIAAPPTRVGISSTGLMQESEESSTPLYLSSQPKNSVIGPFYVITAC